MTLVLEKTVYDYDGEQGSEDYKFTPKREELRLALSLILRDLYFKDGGRKAEDSIYEFLGDVDMEYIAENYEDDLKAYFQEELREEEKYE